MSKKYSGRRINPTNISAGVNPLIPTHIQVKIEKRDRKKHKRAVKEFFKSLDLKTK